MVIRVNRNNSVSRTAAQGATMGRYDANTAGKVAEAAQAGASVYQQIHETQAQESRDSFQREVNSLLQNPETGYLNRRGKKAVDTRKSVNEEIGKIRDRHAEGLSGLSLREFERVSEGILASTNGLMDNHESRERETWQRTTINSSVENTMENATLYWRPQDSKFFKAHMSAGLSNIEWLGEIEGWDSATLVEKKETFASSYRATAVESALSQSGHEAAAELLTSFGEGIEPDSRVELEGKIQKAKGQAETAALSSRASQLAAVVLRDNPDRLAANQRIEEMADGDTELRDKLRSEVNYQLGMRKTALGEARTEIVNEAEQYLRTGSLNEFIAGNPEKWDLLLEKQKRALEKGDTAVTDWPKYVNLMTLPEKELAKLDVSEYITSLAPAQRSTLLNAVRSARNGSPDEQYGRSRFTQTKSMAIQLFGDVDKWNGDTAEQVNSFYAMTDAEVSRREAANGGNPLTSREYTEVLDGFAEKIVTEDNWFQQNIMSGTRTLADVEAESSRMATRALEMTGEPLNMQSIHRVNRELYQVREYLEDNGVTVTDDVLLRAYIDARE